MHSTRTNEHRPLHIFFFPFLVHGHTAPMVDMARLFSSQGIKATLITTPLNIPFISKTLTSNDAIHVKTINQPDVEANSTQGCKIQDQLSLDMDHALLKATTKLQDPLERAMLELHPDCIIVDMLFPWAAQSAAKFGIPTLAFYVSSLFSLCASECMRLYHPDYDVSMDSEVFVIPSLPGEITMTKMQVEDLVSKIEEPEHGSVIKAAKKFCTGSHGLVVNSFYELERDYFNFYRNVLGKKVRHIGPLPLCKRDLERKANIGKEASTEEHKCLKWLDTKKSNSVVYVCFGTLINLPESQLREIAMGLEASGQQFIWVVRKSKKDEEEEDKEEWLPSGFEERTQGKGLIIRDWAPQVLILEHEAIGAFVTHCGWNATLEAVSAGIPMITWPWYFEQFYNEKLVTQVLRIGVPVGAKKWSRFEKDDIKWEAIEKAVKTIMEGEEADEMRNRAKVLAQKSRQAVEKGGSSYSDLNALIEDLALRCH